MGRLERIGAFALTEPTGGSDVAAGLRTTARRDGDGWVLDGAKRWIGNATFADHVVTWALRRTRSGVAWSSVGVMLAAYEIALAYATEREQFGRTTACSEASSSCRTCWSGCSATSPPASAW